MTWKRTRIFLFLLVAVSGFYYWKAHEKPTGENSFSFSTEAAKAKILSLSPHESVDRLTIHNPSQDGEISFLKEKNGNWKIIKPVDYPAESMMVDGFVGLLKLTLRIRQLSFEGLGAEDFGFDTPRFSVCVSTNSSRKERCLLVGSDAVIVKGAYAKWEDEAKYFVVDPNFLAAFDRSLYSVRKKQIFTLLEKEVEVIQFRSQKREFEIRRQKKQWMLKRPVEAILGPEAINHLSLHLSDLYVKEFLDDERLDDPKLGLKPGHRVIRIKFGDGSEQALIQGREAAGRDAYFAQGPDGKTTLLVSLGKLNKIEEAFRSLVS